MATDSQHSEAAFYFCASNGRIGLMLVTRNVKGFSDTE
jgi:hypothetical protein